MVSRAAARVALLGGLVAASAPAANAQSLPRLTVESFVLSADTPAPRVDVPFHLILTLRVRERITLIENLNLPMLAELELLGDERETTNAPRGTLYRETITVVDRQTGALSIPPATLQAIDARDGKPKEWFTNSLTLQVGGAPPQVLRNGVRLVGEAARVLFWLLLWVLGLGALGIAAMLLFRRRRPPTAVVTAPAPPPAAERSRREKAADALTVLRAERTRGAAVAVRAAIWRLIGASDGETLGDVLRRPESSDATMRHLLIALERSAFTYDGDLRAAIDDACAALERYAESAA